jgi:hypothetical protein
MSCTRAPPTLPNNLHTHLADLPRRGGIRLMTLVISLSLTSIAGRMHAGPAARPALVTGATVRSAAHCNGFYGLVGADSITGGRGRGFRVLARLRVDFAGFAVFEGAASTEENDSVEDVAKMG